MSAIKKKKKKMENFTTSSKPKNTRVLKHQNAQI